MVCAHVASAVFLLSVAVCLRNARVSRRGAPLLSPSRCLTHKYLLRACPVTGRAHGRAERERARSLTRLQARGGFGEAVEGHPGLPSREKAPKESVLCRRRRIIFVRCAEGKFIALSTCADVDTMTPPSCVRLAEALKECRPVVLARLRCNRHFFTSRHEVECPPRVSGMTTPGRGGRSASVQEPAGGGGGGACRPALSLQTEARRLRCLVGPWFPMGTGFAWRMSQPLACSSSSFPLSVSWRF